MQAPINNTEDYDYTIGIKKEELAEYLPSVIKTMVRTEIQQCMKADYINGVIKETSLVAPGKYKTTRIFIYEMLSTIVSDIIGEDPKTMAHLHKLILISKSFEPLEDYARDRYLDLEGTLREMVHFVVEHLDEVEWDTDNYDSDDVVDMDWYAELQQRFSGLY